MSSYNITLKKQVCTKKCFIPLFEFAKLTFNA